MKGSFKYYDDIIENALLQISYDLQREFKLPSPATYNGLPFYRVCLPVSCGVISEDTYPEFDVLNSAMFKIEKYLVGNRKIKLWVRIE